MAQWLVDRDFGGRAIPEGGVQTGAGGTSTPDSTLIAFGGALLLLGAGVGFSARRRARAVSRAR